MAQETVDTIQLVTQWATIASFGIAAATAFISVVTYWISWNRKRIQWHRLKEVIKVEIRTLYFASLEDIVNLGQVMSDLKEATKGFKPFPKYLSKIYNAPNLKRILASGQYLDLFYTIEEQSQISTIVLDIEQIEKYDKFGLQHNNQEVQERFLKKRLAQLRYDLIALSLMTKWIDLSIMPKELVGDTRIGEGKYKQYRELQKLEEQSLEVLTAHCPEKAIRCQNQDFTWMDEK